MGWASQLRIYPLQWSQVYQSKEQKDTDDYSYQPVSHEFGPLR